MSDDVTPKEPPKPATQVRQPIGGLCPHCLTSIILCKCKLVKVGNRIITEVQHE